MNIGDIVSEVLLYVNIIGGLIVGIANLVLGIKHRKEIGNWARWVYAGLGLYWAIVYSILEFVPLHNAEYIFTSTYIRPSITVLIVLVVIESIANFKPIYLPDVVKNIIAKIKERRKNAISKHY